MKWEAMLKSVDQLVFEKTGKHLDSLQLAILKGVLNSQKYSEIAEKYGCTTGHATDEGYKLWQILSEILGEDVHKSNFCAIAERLGIANSNSMLVNPVQIGHLNLCSNSEIVELEQSEEQSDIFTPESSHQNTKSERPMIKEIQLETKLKTIPKLIKIGLTAPQIAETLELSLNQVQQVINQIQQ
ncbi:hypothetical protein PJF56_00445 [Roseofilum sp. BLCC_M91]|uniref:vWA-MoxR associated protein N-terminal HTH domain-containing protein n=1 Tax=Roseofilum halophilum BLCC-M91 TaxID=3022259 RepID=A0ABT7BFK8_9CYAN|nr:hypothetical protein [Roseofilum halophilum]MDJ1177321.1 hypothetical protein [Roseofilum halophilum BLCC-M91]